MQAEVELLQEMQLKSAQMTHRPAGLTVKVLLRHWPHSRLAEQLTQFESAQRKQKPLKRVTVSPMAAAEELQTEQTSATRQDEQLETLQEREQVALVLRM